MVAGLALLMAGQACAPETTREVPPATRKAPAEKSKRSAELVGGIASADPCVRSNVDGIDGVTISDLVYVRNNLFCDAGEPPPPVVVYDPIFAGDVEAIGFNPFTDQAKTWLITDANVNGSGHDASLYAIGRNCLIQRSIFDGGKHGLRVASVDGLVVRDCVIRSSGVRGSAVKICGIGDRGPSSRNVTIERCHFTGRLAIKPQNRTNAGLERIERVTIRDCTVMPWGNTGVRIAAADVWCENVTVNFRGNPAGEPMGFVVTDYYGCRPERVTIRNCRILTDAHQRGRLVVADIPIGE
jgi:hypothetical protein